MSSTHGSGSRGQPEVPLQSRKHGRLSAMIELDSLDERLDDIAIRLAKIIQELTEIAPAAGPETEHIATIVRLLRANADLAGGIAQLLSNL
jgi:hypothetical protein